MIVVDVKSEKWRDEQRDTDQMGDCFTKQDQNGGKICLLF